MNMLAAPLGCRYLRCVYNIHVHSSAPNTDEIRGGSFFGIREAPYLHYCCRFAGPQASIHHSSLLTRFFALSILCMAMLLIFAGLY
jgi:hypothetical protein